MADGVRFDIAIEANSMGVDTSAEQLNAFVDKIQAVNRTATTFDRVVNAARQRLEESAAASKLAAASLSTAEAKYRELEGAANKAAKEVEKATLAGKDTSALKLAALQAADAMRAQASVVDDLKAKSDAAAASQSKLAATLKTLETQQAAAAADIKKGIAKELDGANEKITKAGGDDKKKGLEKTGKGFETLKGQIGGARVMLLGYALAALGAAGGLGYLMSASHPGMMMAFSMAAARARLGLVQIFQGIKVDKLVNAVGDLSTLFQKGTSSANGLKTIVDTLFQPLIDGAAKAEPFIKEVFKGVIYGVLLTILAFLKLRNAILAALPPEARAAIKKFTDDHFNLQNAFKVGAALGVILVATIAVLTVSLLAMAVAELAALWPILLIIAVIALVIAAILYWDDIVQALSDTWDDFVDGVKDAVKSIIDGIVNGIKNGVGRVVDAFKNLASKGVDAFKDMLGIKSPSAVMALQGHYTVQGYVEGIEDNAPKAQDAMASMVSVPDGKANGSGAAPTSTGGTATRGAPLIGQLIVNARTVEDANGIADVILQTLEKAAAQLGGGEVPQGAAA